jgi:hypothetical protein
MFQVTSTHGICRADVSGNIGSCSPKHAIGFATVSQDTSSLYTLTEGSTISVICGTEFSKLSDHRYQGWFAGAGIAYGYALPLAKHWNAEFEIGIGYAYSRYDKFECEGCGQKVEKDKSHNYFGPTKAAISLVYVF